VPCAGSRLGGLPGSCSGAVSEGRIWELGLRGELRMGSLWLWGQGSNILVPVGLFLLGVASLMGLRKEQKVELFLLTHTNEDTSTREAPDLL